MQPAPHFLFFWAISSACLTTSPTVVPITSDILASSAMLNGYCDGASSRLWSVVLGITAFFAVSKTFDPASFIRFLTIAATASAYLVLSILCILMPNWAMSRRHAAHLGTILKRKRAYNAHMDMNEAVSRAISAERSAAKLTIIQPHAFTLCNVNAHPACRIVVVHRQIDSLALSASAASDSALQWV